MYFPGSLLLMEGAVQEDWLHCLPKVEKNACSLPLYFCEIAGPALQGGEGEPDLQDDVQCRPCVLEAPDDIKLVQYRSPCMHFAQVSQCHQGVRVPKRHKRTFLWFLSNTNPSHVGWMAHFIHGIETPDFWLEIVMKEREEWGIWKPPLPCWEL